VTFHVYACVGKKLLFRRVRRNSATLLVGRELIYGGGVLTTPSLFLQWEWGTHVPSPIQGGTGKCCPRKKFSTSRGD